MLKFGSSASFLFSFWPLAADMQRYAKDVRLDKNQIEDISGQSYKTFYARKLRL